MTSMRSGVAPRRRTQVKPSLAKLGPLPALDVAKLCVLNTQLGLQAVPGFENYVVGSTVFWTKVLGKEGPISFVEGFRRTEMSS